MFNYLVTVGPSVADNRMPGDFVSNAGHPQHALFVAAVAVGTGAAVISLVRSYGAREPFGMIGGIVAVNAVAREHGRT